jgi:hypothetical protein
MNMKNILTALLFVSALVVSSCHYGEEEAAKTLERNELYKGDKADFSVNRAGDGAAAEESAEAPHDSVSAGPAPSATQPAEPAAHTEPAAHSDHH